MSKASKEKPLQGFKTVKGKGRIKHVDGGGYVVDNGGDFGAYDAKGRYLGWTPSLMVAELAAKNGWHLSADVSSAGELSLWCLWNDAVNAGARVMEDKENKTQFMNVLGHGIISAADGERGWDVEVIGVEDLWEKYGQKVDGQDILQLTVAEKPFLLE